VPFDIGEDSVKTEDAAVVRKRNEDTYRQMHDALNAGDADGYIKHVADDVVYEAPYYRENNEPLASGRDNLYKMLGNLQQSFSRLHYDIQGFIPALDPNLIIAEVTGDNEIADTGKPYRNEYVFFVYFDDEGKVVRSKELSNPLIMQEARTPK
jgi:ketosteroid isomerase-like protein